jgi:hypothetical protein
MVPTTSILFSKGCGLITKPVTGIGGVSFPLENSLGLPVDLVQRENNRAETKENKISNKNLLSFIS